MASDGSAPTQVTFAPPDARDGYPAWSPDGRKIAFTRFTSTISGSGPGQLWTVDVDGSGETQLTNASQQDIRADWQPLPGLRREDYKNATQFCKAERKFLGDAVFPEHYGGGANAYGKCVSGK